MLVAGLFLGATAPVASAEPIRLVALGDSLMAGYELPAPAAFPEQLEAALREEGYDVEVVNAGVSGDTASAGRDRLDWAVPDDADGVIVGLGANDALRGIDPTITRAALTEIVARLRERGVEVLLAGMLAPSNMDAEYRKPFEAIYRDLADAHDLVFYPFFLEGVAMEPALNLSDGMHPNQEGVKVIVEGILPRVEELIERIEEAG